MMQKYCNLQKDAEQILFRRLSRVGSIDDYFGYFWIRILPISLALWGLHNFSKIFFVQEAGEIVKQLDQHLQVGTPGSSTSCP
jgi:hypothetical protein